MSALLSCAGLSRRFGGVLALDALSLEVPRESVLGLIGPNGSGKTTFFNVLTGLFAPSAGEVRFDGAAVTGLSPQRVYRLGIARTFQRSRLCLSLSVFDNLMVGNHRNLDHGFFVNLVARGRLARQVAASRARARELLRTFDERLSGCLDAPAGSIPMIDRRRVEVCRALISRPKLLLLDEPSAGMTHDETLRLMDDILKVQEELRLAIVLIEHEMSVIARVTGRCVVLNYGRKIAEGTFAEVAQDAQVQKAYLGLS